jgi:hypothetical protein
VGRYDEEEEARARWRAEDDSIWPCARCRRGSHVRLEKEKEGGERIQGRAAKLSESSVPVRLPWTNPQGRAWRQGPTAASWR